MKDLFAFVIILAGSFYALTAVGATISTTSPKGHEAVKAEVLDATPANYTIDVQSFSNLGVDQDAPTFAVYTSSRLPETCGDFSSTGLGYEKPSKYRRVFDLSKQQDIITAINQYGCVVIPNK